MAEIKSLSRAAAKWLRRAGSAGLEYEEGVKNPAKDWQTNTSQAEKAYEQGVQASIQRKSFGKGVKNAGTEKWQTNAIAKGVPRYTAGVALAEANYETGFAPYREVIAALNLPPRGPKGDPNNIRRVAMISEALHKKRLELQSK
jgi:DNA-binding transcriptional MocR family regulator